MITLRVTEPLEGWPAGMGYRHSKIELAPPTMSSGLVWQQAADAIVRSEELIAETHRIREMAEHVKRGTARMRHEQTLALAESIQRLQAYAQAIV